MHNLPIPVSLDELVFTGWIDEKGNLLMLASKFVRTAGLNSGKTVVEPPITLYSLATAAKAVRR